MIVFDEGEWGHIEGSADAEEVIKPSGGRAIGDGAFEILGRRESHSEMPFADGNGEVSLGFEIGWDG